LEIISAFAYRHREREKRKKERGEKKEEEKKPCAEVAGRRTFRILTSSQ